MLVVSYALALGPRLYIDTRNTGIRMPFTILIHLPVIQDLLPVRFSLFVQFFAALILAIGLDRLYRWLRLRYAGRGTHVRSRSRNPRWVAAGITAFVAAAALFALTPDIPYVAAPTNIPSVFEYPAIDNIPSQSVVLSYPYPFNPEDQILLPQALSNMKFKIIGGPGHVPHPPGFAHYGPGILQPVTVEDVFNAAYHDQKLVAEKYTAVTPANLAALRTFLVRYHVGTVVLYQVGWDPSAIVQYVRAVLGPPQWTQGTIAWFGVQQDLERTAAGS